MLGHIQAASIHQLVESQVNRSPATPAVIFEGQQLTYFQLNAKANQLAHYLQTLGVGPDVLVGVYLERSLEMLIGLLGILKAGGAYVPLDPAHPKERLAFMLEDAQLSVLLTQAHLIDSLPQHSAQLLCLDRNWEVIAQQSSENPAGDLNPDRLAYAIYTSGSTGKPKGVLIPHRGVVNFLESMRERPGISERDVLLAVTTITFDIAALELFLPLTVGACVEIASRDVATDGLQLAKKLNTAGITLMQATPATWQLLLKAGWSGNPQLKILCGGEALHRELANQLLDNCAALWNLYGPTETTIWSTVCQVEAGPSKISMGQPITNTTLYLLDEKLQAVTAGEVGELYIGGVGLAKGYLNRPELTAEKFIAHPFPDPDQPPSKLYKTGDLARYLPDGTLEYLGRIDHQVKIRGYRIELGEIESLLLQHPTIQQVAVIAREDRPGDKRLVAYLVTNLIPERLPYQSSVIAEREGTSAIPVATEDLSSSGVCLTGVPATWQRGDRLRLQVLLPGSSERLWLTGTVAWCQEQRAGVQFLLGPVDRTRLQQSFEYLLETQGFLKLLQRTLASNLRSFLKDKLPEYMIPSSFVFLNALPLTPNCKVDRNALPAPTPAGTGTHGAGVQVTPRTPIEAELSQIWAEVLKQEQIGIHDNFLELGGHSLLATQILSRLRDAFAVELPLRSLFEAPTIAQLAERIETARQDISPRSVLSLWSVVRPPVLPLSYSQEPLWFLAQFVPNHPFYNVQEVIRITGLLNVPVLEKAFRDIIQRHEILRTTFNWVNEQPVQTVHPGPLFALKTVQAQDLVEAQHLAREEGRYAFDLTQTPPLRITLFQISAEEALLSLNLHHILCDDWSTGLLLQELTILYEALAMGKPSPLPSLTLQYADFAVWQRQSLCGPLLDRQLTYWKQQLSGPLPTLQLPTDRPRPDVPSYQGGRQPFSLSSSVTEALKTLGRQEGATLFMVLLAAFQTLLWRYTGQDDCLVGSPVANRNRLELEGLLGCFLNTLVRRTDLAGEPSFRQLLGRVRSMTLAAYAAAEVPFERLVKELQPEREVSHNPLFQVMFSLQSDPLPVREVLNLTLRPVEVHNGTAKFDLFLNLWETSAGVQGYFEYSTDLFKAETIAQMAGHLETVIAGIVANPDRALQDLPLLTLAEQQQLLAWNQTQAPYPQNRCVHHWFEQQVQLTPDAIAVVFGAEQLTYRELNQRANQLAHELRSQGMGPDRVVGVWAERSLWSVIAILGILKAGGAYLPLDPAYPQERLTFMLENAQVSLIVSHAAVLSQSPAGSQTALRVICLDRDWEIIAQHVPEPPQSEVTPEHLAYVIYTSGSTGKPKGVAMSHRPLVNLLAWQLANFRTPAARTLQFAPISFDVSFQEMFSTWCAGGTLVLIAETVRRDPISLLQTLAEAEIERLFLPFVALQNLAEVAVTQSIIPVALREVITAGEQLQVSRSIAQWFERLPDCTLQNQYGPSESHVVTAFTLTGNPKDWPALPPIGRPIANAQIYLLDSHLQSVPLGMPGELCIGGVSLAQGYLNRPDLTAQKFITNPFAKDIEGSDLTAEFPSKLYKTGDLARYLPDGNIEYLGRLDSQVKIRGYRIELGEIEAVLSQHYAVRGAAVTVREDVPGHKRLVAYLVANSHSTIVSELRNFLQGKLPDYMIPATFVCLDVLPLTPSGKVDRRA